MKNLSKTLAEKQILIPGLTVSATIPVRIFGNAIVQKEKRGIIVKVDNESMLVSYEHGVKKNTKFEDIVSIEGMEVARFAQAYKVKTPKK